MRKHKPFVWNNALNSPQVSSTLLMNINYVMWDSPSPNWFAERHIELRHFAQSYNTCYASAFDKQYDALKMAFLQVAWKYIYY